MNKTCRAPLIVSSYDTTHKVLGAERDADTFMRHVVVSERVQRVANVSPCVHHWLVAPDEDWCDCDGTQHFHAWCWECGDERTFPRIVAWTLWDPEAADVIMEKGRRLA